MPQRERADIGQGTAGHGRALCARKARDRRVPRWCDTQYIANDRPAQIGIRASVAARSRCGLRNRSPKGSRSVSVSGLGRLAGPRCARQTPRCATPPDGRGDEFRSANAPNHCDRPQPRDIFMPNLHKYTEAQTAEFPLTLGTSRNRGSECQRLSNWRAVIPP